MADAASIPMTGSATNGNPVVVVIQALQLQLSCKDGNCGWC